MYPRAIALGAKIIEKHFILDRKLGGPDAAFSLEPEEFMAMVKAVREVEKALKYFSLCFLNPLPFAPIVHMSICRG